MWILGLPPAVIALALLADPGHFEPWVWVLVPAATAAWSIDRDAWASYGPSVVAAAVWIIACFLALSYLVMLVVRLID